MMRATVAALAMLLAIHPGAAQEQCVNEMDQFDYMSTSEQQFWLGSVDEVRRGYRAMLDQIGDVASVQRATQYAVDPETFSIVTARECEEELCTGRDLVQGLIECEVEVGHRCSPLAAIKDGTLYCVLQPEYEYGQPSFKPFG